MARPHDPAGADAAPAGPNGPAVVLVSGGMDSAVVLAELIARGHRCHAVSFDYGQRHRVELACAASVARALGAASHRVMRIDAQQFAGSALTDVAVTVPKGRTTEQIAGGIPATYVPARNLVFLALATALAEVVGARVIGIGVNAVDYSGYPDCRGEFVRAFEAAANLATRAGVEGRGVRVVAPLIDMPKAQIVRLGASRGVDFGLTSSCYDPGQGDDGRPRACGGCDACAIRAAGFAAAGLTDPAAGPAAAPAGARA